MNRDAAGGTVIYRALQDAPGLKLGQGRVGKVHSNYHIPISNTATGLLVLENRA